jgi:hypothetical protein
MKVEPVGYAASILSIWFLLACGADPTTTDAPTEAQSTESGPGGRKFVFAVQGGQEIVATVRADPSSSGKQLVIFAPFLIKTDGNLYNAALHSLWNVYGKERGLFQLRDARLSSEPALGGNAICWQVSNPAQDFCIFPTKDSATQQIAAITIWLK